MYENCPPKTMQHCHSATNTSQFKMSTENSELTKRGFKSWQHFEETWDRVDVAGRACVESLKKRITELHEKLEEQNQILICQNEMLKVASDSYNKK